MERIECEPLGLTGSVVVARERLGRFAASPPDLDLSMSGCKLSLLAISDPAVVLSVKKHFASVLPIKVHGIGFVCNPGRVSQFGSASRTSITYWIA